MKTKRPILILAIMAGFPIFAALPVVDVAAIARLIDQINWMKKQHTQLVDTYKTITDQYKQMVIDAKWITNKARWKAVLSPWKFSTATNTYGTTGGWIGAANSGVNAFDGYRNAVITLLDYSPVWAGLPPSQRERIGRNYSTVELSDGTSVNAIFTLGTIRGNGPVIEKTIAQLETDSLSDDANLNTHVGILNKINAATLVAIRTSQDANKLLAAIVEQDLVQTKAKRDAQAQSINNEVAAMQAAPALTSKHITGTTALLSTYRIP